MTEDEIYEVVKEERRLANLTQRDLSELSGWSRHAINKMETGHTSIRVGTLIDLCDCLGLEVLILRRDE